MDKKLKKLKLKYCFQRNIGLLTWLHIPDVAMLVLCFGMSLLGIWLNGFPVRNTRRCRQNWQNRSKNWRRCITCWKQRPYLMRYLEGGRL